MPEINSKRNTQTGNRSKKKQKQKNTNSPSKHNKKKKNRKKRPITGDSITWGSSQTKEEVPRVSRKQWYYILVGLIFLFLFILWAFVPDRNTLKKRAATKKAEKREKQKRSQKQEEMLNRKLGTFQYAQLLNSSEFTFALKNMHEGEFYDRIMLVAFEDSTKDAEANPLKVKIFKKYESLAKSLPRKSLFKRYDSEDLPLIILFDCGNPNDPSAEQICSKIIGSSLPNQLVFRSQQQPRQLPSEHKSQNQILQYLYNLMQPAVKYLEELIDAEDFVANDEHLNVIYFSSMNAVQNSIPQKTFEMTADKLRDYARFARTKNTAIIDAFDVDIKDLPSILIWRTFGGENPQIFSGNMSYEESVNDFVMNNYIPIFSEFTPKTSSKYMKRGLPILWIAYNIDDESVDLVELLEVSEHIAHRYLGHLTFTQLDVKGQPQIASNFGLDFSKPSSVDDDDDDDESSSDPVLPQAFIMNQIAQVNEIIDMDDIEGSIQKVVESYMKTLRVHRGDVMPELSDEYDSELDEDDEDFLEDDDDEDDEEDDVVELSELDDVLDGDDGGEESDDLLQHANVESKNEL